MRTKVMDKKGMKRSPGTSHPPKLGKKPKGAIKSGPKSPKKPGVVGSVRNGKLINKAKERALKDFVDQMGKQSKNAKQENSTAGSPEQGIKTQAKQATKFATAKIKKNTTDKKIKKLEFMKKITAKRALAKEKRKQDGTRKGGVKMPSKLTMEWLKIRIEEIKSREALSKTAKKKLASFNKKLELMQSGVIPEGVAIVKGKHDKKLGPQEVAESKQTTNVDDKAKAKRKLQNQKVKDTDEDDSTLGEEEDDTDEDEIDVEEKEEEEESMDMDNTDSETDDESNEEITDEEKSNKNQKKEATRSPIDEKKQEKGKKEFFLFVTNLPHNITEDEVKQHILTKVDKVLSVKILASPGTMVSSAAARVKLSNGTDCTKALALHDTLVGEKKIVIRYPAANKKQKNIARSKQVNVLQKPGKLAGGVQKKRNKPSRKRKQNAGATKA